jgi:adenylate cyclase
VKRAVKAVGAVRAVTRRVRIVFLTALAALTASTALPAQCPNGAPPPCARTASARVPSPNSIAVLYFDNVSRDSSDADLADGLTDEIILRLQQVHRLEVKSRYESQRVRGRLHAAPSDLGRDLGARYLVNGTIQRAGPRLVVRVELTRADRGVGVWSERYDRTSENVLDVIDDVARGVATGVAGQLLPQEAAQIAQRPSGNPVAYEHYVRGNVYLARRTPGMLQRAIDEYEAARAADPGMAVATGRIAYTYSLGTVLGVGELPADSVKARAAAAIARAVREAPAVPETWLAQGFRALIASLFERADRLGEAVAGLGRGVQLGPDNAEAHHQYAQGLVIAGEDSAALAEYRTALRLEPGRAVSYEEISRELVILGRYAEALANADSALAADPQLVRGLLTRARARLMLGDVSAADRDVTAAASLATAGRNANEVRSLRAMVLAAQGDTAQARQVAASLIGANTVFGDDMYPAVGWGERGLDRIEAESGPGARCYRLRYPLVRLQRGTPHYDRLATGCR